MSRLAQMSAESDIEKRGREVTHPGYVHIGWSLERFAYGMKLGKLRIIWRYGDDIQHRMKRQEMRIRSLTVSEALKRAEEGRTGVLEPCGPT